MVNFFEVWGLPKNPTALAVGVVKSVFILNGIEKDQMKRNEKDLIEQSEEANFYMLLSGKNNQNH
ncbi:hypothetical protein MK805_08075 [Shimazuella sp. AN120528]|uniref:hypothetical protein n=1 Tax=Shimazuella soli TaxID=1892854 RepID=UPI001F112989|nr:hypothetical protein [Shimazuella soli]MCH5584929.1 hypothetical protein [Shimazuella soli]